MPDELFNISVSKVAGPDVSDVTGEASPVMRAMRRFGRRVEADAKMRAPVDTGRLRQSIGHDIAVSGSRIRMTVFADVGYARFVHEGTGPHVIRPKHAQALRFQSNGKTIFASVVHHPGTRPRPFLRNAVREQIARL